MTLPVITNVTRVACIGTNELGNPWVNVLHFLHSGGYGSNTDNAALALKLNKLYGGPGYAGADEYMLRRCNALVTLGQYIFTPLDGITASFTSAATPFGGDAAQGTPPEISQVLTLYSLNRGRRYRGRVFLPNWSIDAYSAAGQPGASILTNYVAQATAFLGDLASINWSWVIASYKFASSIAVSSVAMHAVTAAMRRRRGFYP